MKTSDDESVDDATDDAGDAADEDEVGCASDMMTQEGAFLVVEHPLNDYENS